MKNCLCKTDDNLTGLILRLTMGIVMFPHGAQKLLGWFGGSGFSKTVEVFQSMMGIPTPVAYLVIIGESIGALGLIVGFATRFCAASIGIIMIGAAVMAHGEHGFFMNWFLVPGKGHGFEYHILAVGICAALLITGGGRFSADGALCKNKE